MIKLIYGPKGFGKTKIIMDDVDAAAKQAKGNVVFITDKKICSVSIDLNVRCVYTEEYGINSADFTVKAIENTVGDENSADSFTGFIMGLIAGNSDIEYIFIDGVLRIANCGLGDLEPLFADLKKYNDVKVEMTVSAEKKDLPKFMLEYV